MKRILSFLIPLSLSAALLLSCGATTVSSSNSGSSQSGATSSSSNSSGASNSSSSSNGSDSSATSAGSQSSLSTSATSLPSSAQSNSLISADEGTVTITLADGNSVSSSSSNVSIDNSNNLITISSVGVYLLTGSLSNGTILVSAEETSSNDEVELILNGVSISKDGSKNAYGPLVSTLSSKTLLRVPDGTVSVITDSRKSTDSGVADSDDNAAIFSNKKLLIKGTGSLKVISTFNNGLASDSKVRIKEAKIDISAPNHAIKAHDSVILGQKDCSGSFLLTSTGSDGAGIRVDEVDTDVTSPVYGNDEADDDIAGIEIKDGTYAISAAGKGISSEAYLYMEGGEGTIKSSADKGLKSELDAHIDGGTFVVTTPKDDCIHSSTAKIVATGGN